MRLVNKIIIFMIMFFILILPAVSGVNKKTKSTVSLKGIGDLTTEQSSKMTQDKCSTDKINDFKGKGLAGKTIGFLAFRSGNYGEIIDLPGSKIYTLDHKKKEYTERAIEKISQEDLGKGKPDSTGKTETEPEKNTIKVIRKEFTVTDTGETKNINSFSCKRFNIHWLVEWENTETGDKGINNLETIVWTTTVTAAMKAAEQEELKFSMEYMKKLGLGTELKKSDMLGTEWINIFNSAHPGQTSMSPDSAQAAKELAKIKGYPIVIDGKYFVINTPNQAAKEKSEPVETETQEQGPTDLKSKLGKFALDKMKKKSEEKKTEGTSDPAAPVPVISYYIEIVEFAPGNIDAAIFTVPAGYKKK